jgi:hypothetical protein
VDEIDEKRKQEKEMEMVIFILNSLKEEESREIHTRYVDWIFIFLIK